MEAGKIIKNEKADAANKEHPRASALAVENGKFANVGDEAGLADFEGGACDLGGMKAN